MCVVCGLFFFFFLFPVVLYCKDYVCWWLFNAVVRLLIKMSSASVISNSK